MMRRQNVNILRLTDIQDKPKLSSLMLSLLAEIYQQMPEKEMLISRNLWFYRRGTLNFLKKAY
jgi:hypothetical protein